MSANEPAKFQRTSADADERREQEEEEERRRKRPRYVDDEAEESDGSE